MKRIEISIHILDKNYIDSLIVALVRQGYEVYYNEDENKVCFITDKDEVFECE